MNYSKYVIKLDDDKHVYLFNTKNNLSVKIEKNLLKDLKNDTELFNRFQIFLADHQFYTAENEKSSTLKMLQNKDNDTLRIIILAHGDCNFRCKYCYEKFENICIHDKVSDIISFIKNKLSEKNFSRLHISWFGGEPLLGYREILDISDILITYCNKNDILYSADITTNGYLLSPTVFSKLVNLCKITTFQITIDGTQKGHDNQRVLKNGHGSYRRVIDNLLSTINTSLSFQIIIRMNVSKENSEDVKNFLNTDAKYFKPDKRFKFIFRNVGNWGCGERVKGYEVEMFEKDISFEFSKYALSQGFRLFDPSIIATNNLACYAQKKNSYVIDTTGKLLKCTVALYEDCNVIGNIANGVTNTNNQDLWVNNLDCFSNKCENCELLFICKGGFCPKIRVMNSTTHDICEEMKQMITNNFRLKILSNDFNFVLRRK